MQYSDLFLENFTVLCMFCSNRYPLKFIKNWLRKNVGMIADHLHHNTTTGPLCTCCRNQYIAVQHNYQALDSFTNRIASSMISSSLFAATDLSTGAC